MYGQHLKVTESVKFLGVHIDNHLSMKLHVEHIEKVSKPLSSICKKSS